MAKKKDKAEESQVSQEDFIPEPEEIVNQEVPASLSGKKKSKKEATEEELQKLESMESLQMTTEQRQKMEAITLGVKAVEKRYGRGTVMRMGDNQARIIIESFSSGSIGLDMALGVGGYPRGRVVEIYGPEAGGKTTMALHAVASAQKRGGNALFIDAEHALDLQYAKALGVDVDNLLLSQPDHGEQALEILDMLISTYGFDIAVVDSVAALVPKAELEGEMGDSHMGLQARLMSQALRKLTALVSQTKTTVIFINQLRQKIGIMFGNPETTTGGNALKFYASVRLDVRRVGAIKEGDEVLGNTTRVKVVKNKLAPPFRQAEFDLIYGRGIVKALEVLDLGVKFEVIEKSGTWYRYMGEAVGNGRKGAQMKLEETPSLMASIEEQLLVKMRAK